MNFNSIFRLHAGLLTLTILIPALHFNILFAQNNQQPNNGSYEETITITTDGNEKTMIIVKEKDGQTETLVLKGEDIDNYLKEIASPNDQRTPFKRPSIAPGQRPAPFDFGFGNNEWMQRMQEHLSLFPPGLQGFSFPFDSNNFFFGFKNDTSFGNFRLFDSPNFFEDFYNSYEDTPEQIQKQNENFTEYKPKQEAKIRFIRFDEINGKSISTDKAGISDLQMIPHADEGIFRIEFYNKLKKDVSVDIKNADGSHVFGQTFPGPGNISCLVNIKPDQTGIWYIKIYRGKKYHMRRLIIS